MGGGGRLRRVLRWHDRENPVAPLLGRWLARAWWPGCSGAPNRMAKTAKQRGDHGGAHLEQQMAQWATIVARDSGVVPLNSGDGGSSMWGSSFSKMMMGSFATMSSSSSRLQWRRATMNRWCTAVGRVWVLAD
jgi:hypothetical protein